MFDGLKSFLWLAIPVRCLRVGVPAVTAITGLVFLLTAHAGMAEVTAKRLASNPLITVSSSAKVGDNVNGPAVIRVPKWVRRPLGRYYMYFAHHRGHDIRLAYSDAIGGPWKVYEPGALNVGKTAFTRPQPDPTGPALPYTHVASPEVWVDHARKKIVMWFHGYWTDGQRWPATSAAARAWLKENGYGQFTQAGESDNGLDYKPLAPITKQSYLRVVAHDGLYLGMARLSVLMRSRELLGAFEAGPNPFRDGPYANRVRHVALLKRGSTLHVFFSAIGDAPERILHSKIDLRGDWAEWRASMPEEVLAPNASYECADLPVRKSVGGDASGPLRELRDPAVFEENGKIYLFYSVCAEQGIAAAEIVIR